jgi:ribonuclease Z
MLFNVSKYDIRVRMAVIDEHIRALPSVTDKLLADMKRLIGLSKMMLAGREAFEDVVNEIYRHTNEHYGSDVGKL